VRRRARELFAVFPLRRRRTGRTPHQYILNARVERPQWLLRCTDQPIAEIALACGCGAQSRFSKAFHRTVGETPRGYRRRI
jgi:transcriptional regulator GlxA family with amidase domain